MNDWNGLDFIIFLIFAVNTLLGLSEGASRKLISLLCVSVGLIFVIKFTVPLANLLNSSPIIGSFLDNRLTINFMHVIGAGTLTFELLRQILFSISILVCFSFALCACEAVLSARSFVELVSFPYSTMNRKIAAGLGCTRGFVFNVILVNILVLHLFNTNMNQEIKSDVIDNSYFVKLLLPSANKLEALIYSQKPARFNEVYHDKNVYSAKNVLETLKEKEMKRDLAQF